MVGNDHINYPDDVGTPTASLLLIKIFLNKVISTPGANADICPKFTKNQTVWHSEEIIQEYNLHKKMTPDRWVCIKIIQGMYGLPQAGLLGHEMLKEQLNE